jgi:hypothetical protein
MSYYNDGDAPFNQEPYEEEDLICTRCEKEYVYHRGADEFLCDECYALAHRKSIFKKLNKPYAVVAETREMGGKETLNYYILMLKKDKIRGTSFYPVDGHSLTVRRYMDEWEIEDFKKLGLKKVLHNKDGMIYEGEPKFQPYYKAWAKKVEAKLRQ